MSLERPGFDTQVPNNNAPSINMHYQSDTTGEYGTLRLTKSMQGADILKQYTALFPLECQLFLDEVKRINQSLANRTGMSNEGVVMAIAKIPRIVFIAFEYLDEDYWTDKKNFYRFIRAFPKFAIGDHSQKQTHHGSITK